jgi:hypothetical protein
MRRFGLLLIVLVISPLTLQSAGDPVKKRGNLYMVAIGQEKGWVFLPEGFDRVMRDQGKYLYGDIQSRVLTGKNATRKELLDGLDWMCQNAVGPIVLVFDPNVQDVLASEARRGEVGKPIERLIDGVWGAADSDVAGAVAGAIQEVRPMVDVRFKEPACVDRFSWIEAGLPAELIASSSTMEIGLLCAPSNRKTEFGPSCCAAGANIKGPSDDNNVRSSSTSSMSTTPREMARFRPRVPRFRW